MAAETFMGYSVDLLREIHHLGRAVVGDDKLYEASQTYADPKRGGGIFGPALTAADSTKPIDQQVQIVESEELAIEDEESVEKENEVDTPQITYNEAKKILKDAGIEVAHNARKELVFEMLADYQATLAE